MISINIMDKGDEVVTITSQYVAVKKESGEVDIVPIVRSDAVWRVDNENILRIGYGNNTVVYEEDGIKIANF